MPAKRHFMSFCWRTDDGPLIEIFGSSLPSSTEKNVVKVGPTLTFFSGSAHDVYNTDKISECMGFGYLSEYVSSQDSDTSAKMCSPSGVYAVRIYKMMVLIDVLGHN